MQGSAVRPFTITKCVFACWCGKAPRTHCRWRKKSCRLVCTHSTACVTRFPLCAFAVLGRLNSRTEHPGERCLWVVAVRGSGTDSLHVIPMSSCCCFLCEQVLLLQRNLTVPSGVRHCPQRQAYPLLVLVLHFKVYDTVYKCHELTKPKWNQPS